MRVICWQRRDLVDSAVRDLHNSKLPHGKSVIVFLIRVRSCLSSGLPPVVTYMADQMLV
jgi:hypothetical protein